MKAMLLWGFAFGLLNLSTTAQKGLFYALWSAKLKLYSNGYFEPYYGAFLHLFSFK